MLPEGAYTAGLSILYVNGNNPKALSPAITIDVSKPTAAAKADAAVFSPNGDGSKDEVTIFQETSEEMLWTGTISDAKAKEVRSLVWRGRADERFAWDGRDDNGKLLADGTYTYVLTSTDRAGNTVTSAPVSMRIDTEATPVIVATDLPVFSPNGDGVKDRIKFLPTLRVTTGVDAWTFRVRDEGGSPVRAFTGKNAAPGEVSWDGIDDAGKKAKDGRYAVELEVTLRERQQAAGDQQPVPHRHDLPRDLRQRRSAAVLARRRRQARRARGEAGLGRGGPVGRRGQEREGRAGPRLLLEGQGCRLHLGRQG